MSRVSLVLAVSLCFSFSGAPHGLRFLCYLFLMVSSVIVKQVLSFKNVDAQVAAQRWAMVYQDAYFMHCRISPWRLPMFAGIASLFAMIAPGTIHLRLPASGREGRGRFTFICPLIANLVRLFS